MLLFEQHGRLKLHRLVGYEDGQGSDLIFCGDNNRHADPPVPAEAVVGRVKCIERGGRTIAADGVSQRALGRLARVTFSGRPLFSLVYACGRRLRNLFRRRGPECAHS